MSYCQDMAYAILSVVESCEGFDMETAVDTGFSVAHGGNEELIEEKDRWVVFADASCQIADPCDELQALVEYTKQVIHQDDLYMALRHKAACYAKT